MRTTTEPVQVLEVGTYSEAGDRDPITHGQGGPLVRFVTIYGGGRELHVCPVAREVAELPTVGEAIVCTLDVRRKNGANGQPAGLALRIEDWRKGPAVQSAKAA